MSYPLNQGISVSQMGHLIIMLAERHKPKLPQADLSMDGFDTTQSTHIAPLYFMHRPGILLTLLSVNGHFSEHRLIPQMSSELD